MKRASGFVLILLLACSAKDAGPYTFHDLTGTYTAETCDGCTGEGWNTEGMRHDVELILLSDSTYREIHTNYSAFDFVDYWGTWKPAGDSLLLEAKGKLDWKDGVYFPSSDTTDWSPGEDCNQLLRLTVTDHNTLFIHSECSLDGVQLKQTE